MVIDDNYTAMQDTVNVTKPVSAPILATFSKMCPAEPNLAQPNATVCIFNAPEKRPIDAMSAREPVVKAGETTQAPVPLTKAIESDPKVTLVSPALQTSAGEVQEVPGDTKQAATAPAPGGETSSPAAQPSLEQTATAIILLGVLTGVAYFGWKLFKP